MTQRRGTLPLEMTFRGMTERRHPGLKPGELRCASGTKDPKLLADIKAMLRTLYERRRDVLRAVLRGWLDPLETWNAFSAGDLGSLPLSPAYMQPLAKSMEFWADHLKNKFGNPASASHRESLQISINHLTRHAEMVGGLPSALGAVKNELLPGRKRTYQLVRSAALAFVRDQPGLGRHSRLYADVAAVADVYVKANPKQGLPVSVFRERAAKLSPKHQQQAWALATSGMRVEAEYLARKFESVPEGTRVQGAKNGPVRIVPRIAPIMGPFTNYQHLLEALRKADLTPYQCRHSFARWCEEAGIPYSRIKVYMGHAASRGAGVTGGYIAHDTLPELAEDTRKLAAFVGPIEIGLRLERHA